MKKRLLLSSLLAWLLMLGSLGAQSCLSVVMGVPHAMPGTTVCVDITVRGFSNMLGMQYTHVFDPEQLALSSIENFNLPGLAANNFGFGFAPGVIALSWVLPSLGTGETLPDDTPIYTLCFNVLSATEPYSRVRFSGVPTAFEFVRRPVAGQVQVEAPFSAVDGGIIINDPDNNIPLPQFSSICISTSTCSGAASALVEIAGAGNYDYQMAGATGAGTEWSVSAAAPGTYILTATDEDGQSNTATVGLAAEATFGLNATITEGGCTSATGSIALQLQDADAAGYTYAWGHGASTPSLSGLPPGSYMVTVTSPGGCSSARTYIVPNTVLYSNHMHFCDGSNDSVAMYGIVWGGGAAPYTFTWSDAQQNLVAQAVQTSHIPVQVTLPSPGTYTATVIDAGGCQAGLDPISIDCEGTNTGVNIQGSQELAAPGGRACITVSATGFQEVLTAQWSMSFDPAQLLFDTILSHSSLGSLSPGQFSVFGAPSGSLRFAWLSGSPQPVSLPDHAPLFDVCFTVAPDAEGTAYLHFSDTPIPIEIMGADQLPLSVGTAPGSVLISEEIVWPGDTDADGVVTHYDLLHVGLAYGASGPARAGASTDWSAQLGTPWGLSTSVSGIDYMHIDSDGNGIIDAADTLALSLNWGETTDFWSADTERPSGGSSNPPELWVGTDTVHINEVATFPIMLGTAEHPAADAYGIAFSIVYDPAATVPGSALMYFNPSWLRGEGDEILTFYRDRPEQHRIDVAITRTNGLSISGFGAIASCIITIEDVIFRDTSYEMSFELEGVRLINSEEEWMDVAARTTVSIIAGELPTQTSAPGLAARIRLFPVPASQRLYMTTDGLAIVQVQVFAATGQLLATPTVDARGLDVSQWPSGTYMLRILTSEGVAIKRVTK